MEQTKGKTKVKNKTTLELELKEVEIQLKKLEAREKEAMIKFKRVYNEQEVYVIKDKLFKILKKV